MQDAGIIAIPTLIVIIGILFNRHDASEVRKELTAAVGELRKEATARHSETLGRFAVIEEELKTFNRLSGPS